MPAEWAVNAMALLNGEKGNKATPAGYLRGVSALTGGMTGIAQGTQQRFQNDVTRQQLHLAGREQNLAEQTQAASQKSAADQENRMRMQLNTDIRNAERNMQFKWAELGVQQQQGIMDMAIRRESNQIGREGLALDWQKVKFLAGVDLYKDAKTEPRMWLDANLKYILSNGDLARDMTKMGYGGQITSALQRQGASEDQAKMMLQAALAGPVAGAVAGATAAATQPYESFGRRESAGLQNWLATEEGKRTADAARKGEQWARERMQYETDLARGNMGYQANLGDWQAERGLPREIGKMREGATLERGTMQQGQTNALQQLEYSGNIANQQAQQRAASDLQSNMMANPDVVQTWGQNMFGRWMGNFQSHIKGGYSQHQAALAADSYLERDLASMQLPDPVKNQIRQAVVLQRQQALGVSAAPAAYTPYAQPRPGPQQQTFGQFYNQALQHAYGPYQGLPPQQPNAVPTVNRGTAY
jgi:hypothetical protein